MRKSTKLVKLGTILFLDLPFHLSLEFYFILEMQNNKLLYELNRKS